MNNDLYIEYRERFGCRISFSYHNWGMTLSTSEGKLYSVDAATDDQLNELMKESIETGRNVLLDSFKDKEYSLETNPEFDY